MDDNAEFKFVIKFKDRSNKALNSLRISDELKNKMGKGLLNVKMLLNGNIFVFHKSYIQRQNAMKVNHLLGRPIECFIPGQAQKAKGVIYVSPEVSETALLKELKGAEIEEVHRFTESGTAVLITLRGDTLPARVSLGCMSYPVRQYVCPQSALLQVPALWACDSSLQRRPKMWEMWRKS